MALTTVSPALLDTQAQYTGFKNRIINGAMVIDQRNAGAEVNPAVAGSYYLDRWVVNSTTASKFKIGQNAGSVTPPTGFTNYLGATSLSAYTALTSDNFLVVQRIEGFNIADLNWGSASASTVIFSFLVYSSLTGTFGGALRNSGSTRSYPFSYTISSANTWTTVTVTIPGDTSGTWLTTNGIGIVATFSLGAGATFSGTAGAWAAGNFVQPTGSVSVVGTSGATFYITGVQLEKGTQATSFDYRPYGTELMLCQRYYYKATTKPLGAYNGTSFAYGAMALPVTMRIAPTLDAGATFTVSTGAAGTVGLGSTTGLLPSPDAVILYNTASTWTVNANVAVTAGLSAEL